MQYYPVSLDIKNRKCLVVGGGQVGTRKVETLLKCGAVVTVVSLEFTERLLRLEEEGKVTLFKRSYLASDLDDKFLVIGATSDQALNWTISHDAEKLNKLCNIADFPAACNFILPSIVNRGDLTLSISTSGKSPAFARRMRLELEERYGAEYGDFLALMGAVRKKLLSEKHEPEAHKPLFEQLIDGGLLEMIKGGLIGEIDALLFKVLGDGYRYDELMEV